MKHLRSSFLLLAIVLIGGSYLYWNERGPAIPNGAQVLLRVAPERISQIQTGKVNLRREGKKWQVASRNGKNFVAADEKIVAPVLESVQLLQSNSVIERPESLIEYGLEKPRDFLQINETKIELGNAPKFDASRVYAKIDNKIVLLPANLVEFAGRQFEAWRDKTVLSFEPENVTEFSIQAPQIKASFIKNGAVWRVEKPIDAPAETSAIETFLQSLASARVEKWLDEKPSDLKKWGLEKPLAQVEIGGAKLKIGKKIGESYAAQNASSPAIFQISSAIFGLSNRPLRDWRDKTVADFDWNKTRRLSMIWRGKRRDFVKKNRKWQLANEKSNVPINAAIFEILFAIHEWRAQDFVDSPDDLKNYGLEKPILKLSGDVGLEVGQSGGKIYVRREKSANGIIFVLSRDSLGNVKRALDILFPARPGHEEKVRP